MCPTPALKVMMELTRLYLVINQTAKQTMLQVTPKGMEGHLVPTNEGLKWRDTTGSSPEGQFYQKGTLHKEV